LAEISTSAREIARKDQRPLGDEVRRNVGAAEPVDRLLRIAHQEKRPGADRAFLPWEARLALASEPPQDLALQRIRILEFVHQDPRIAQRESLAHCLIGFEKVARVMEQVVEVEKGGLTFVVPVKPLEGIELVNESAEREGPKGGAELLVCSVAGLITLLACGAQPVTVRHLEPGASGRVLPSSLAAPSGEGGFVFLAGIRSGVEKKLGKATAGERSRTRLAR
jgi:hypothetical protein